MSPWLIVGVIGLGTYVIRLSFVAVFGRFGVPTWLGGPLRYVAPAVMAALVAPAVIAPEGPVDVTLSNPRLLAAVIALAVAVRTRSVVWTVVSGMAALLALQAYL